MAFRTWGRVLLAALGVGVLAGAGQLGFAYGFGIVRFARTFDAATANQWTAQLAWVSWFTMVAAVVGAVVADRLARRYDYRPTLGTRLALAAAAALGAAAVAPLSMQPARAAQVASVDPVLATGLSAGLGALIGLAAALAALSQSPIGWNIAAVTGGIWLLALISVMPSLGPTDPLPAVRLGVPDPAWLGAGTTQRLAVVAMPALALIAGAVSGGLARWRGHPMVVVATAGAVGPAMLTLAYLTAGPGDSADKYQAAPYWGALVAAGAGALGSVLAAVMRWPITTHDGDRTPLEPTEILQRVRARLPISDSQPESWSSPYPSGEPPEQPADPANIPGPRRPGEGAAQATSPATPDSPTTPDSRGEEKTSRLRRGLFRRGRRTASTAAEPADETSGAVAEPPAQREPRGHSRPELPVPERDEEYVEWVSGLGASATAEETSTGDRASRRSLRSSGRHHAD